MRRSGFDPIRLDKRPLAEILDDEIPYEKWEKEKQMEEAISASIFITLAYDKLHKEWYVSKSTVPGLKATGNTAEELAEKIPKAVEELIQINVDRESAEST